MRYADVEPMNNVAERTLHPGTFQRKRRVETLRGRARKSL
jgi:hypothetical protein